MSGAHATAYIAWVTGPESASRWTDLAPHELRLLVAVDRAGSFTAAAEVLGMTQSGVSHAVRNCERKIGAVLFERGRNGARPTAAGTRALAHARHILRLLETLGAEARGADADTVTGPLRVAAFRSAAAHLLPAALERLVARYPHIRPQVRIVREVGRGTAGEVADGRADVGIATVSPTSAVPPGLLAAELFAEPYVLAYPVGHPDPRTLPLIDWDENCSTHTRRWLAEQDWIPPATITVEDDSVVLSMVAQRLGTAIMPRLNLRGAPTTIAVAELDAHPPTRHVGYVATPAMAQTRAVRALIRELRASPIAQAARAVVVAGPSSTGRPEHGDLAGLADPSDGCRAAGQAEHRVGQRPAMRSSSEAPRWSGSGSATAGRAGGS